MYLKQLECTSELFLHRIKLNSRLVVILRMTSPSHLKLTEIFFDNYTPRVSRTYCLKVARLDSSLVAIMDRVGMVLLGYATNMLNFY